MADKIKVLDHGYVEFIEAWGHGKDGEDNTVRSEHGDHYINYDVDYEVAIIEAARQSTQGSFRGWNPTPCSCDSTPHQSSCSYEPGDAKLLKFLYSHSHLTPFEFSGMTLEVQAPIFVFREWQRHRTMSYNEMSARYAPLPDLYYEPSIEEVQRRAELAGISTNKQAQAYASGLKSTTPMGDWTRRGWELNEILEQHYQLGLKIGVPKELARIQMPVGHYSRMRCSANLRNWLQFLTLRLNPPAQWEIRQFASAVLDIVKVKFPRTCELFLTQGRRSVTWKPPTAEELVTDLEDDAAKGLYFEIDAENAKILLDYIKSLQANQK